MSWAAQLKRRVSGFVQGAFENDPSDLWELGALPPPARRLQALLQAHRLADLLPYEAYDPDTQVFYNNDTYGFIVEILPSPSLTDDNIRVLAGAFGNEMEANTNVQFCLYASPYVAPWLGRWARARSSDAARRERAKGAGGNSHEIFEALARRRVRYLQDLNWKSAFDSQVMVIRDFRLFLSVQKPYTDKQPALSAQQHKVLDRQRKAILATIESAGMQSRVIDDEILVNLIDTILSPKKFRTRDRKVDPYRYLRDQMLDPDTATMVGRNNVTLAGKDLTLDVRAYTVREYPPAWSGVNLPHLIGSLVDNNRRIGCPFLATLTLHFPDQMAANSTAKTRTARATQMSGTDAARYVPAWAAKKQEWQFVSDMLEQGHVLAKMTYQVILFAPQGNGDLCEQQLLATYKGQRWELTRRRYVVGPLLLNALPMSVGPNQIQENHSFYLLQSMLTWTAVNLAPITAEWKGNGGPLLQLYGRRGQIIHVDPWQNPSGNYNMAISAASGAGKSFFTAEMITSLLGIGGRVWVFDRGRSYQHLCELLDGEFIEFGGERALCINPFSNIKNWAKQGDTQRTGAEGIMLSHIVAQMIEPKKDLGQLERSWVQQALDVVWKSHGTDGDITKVRDALLENEDRRCKDLAQALYVYTQDGPYGEYFNGQANINLDKDFIVLETQDLDSTPDLQSVVVLMLMLKVTQAMYLGDRTRRKLCLIDEAWKLMSRGNQGEFIEEGYRTARKFNGAFATITQGLNDYYKSGTAQAALDNADHVYLLRQKPEVLRQLERQSKLPFPEAALDLVRTLRTEDKKYSELAIIGPEGMAIARHMVDPFTAMLYSTKSTEYQAIEDLVAGGKTLVQAIEILAAGQGG